MATRHYYLDRWIWQPETADTEPHWHAPLGTVGLVDLRPLAETSEFGFFTTAEPIEPGPHGLYLGSDREALLSAAVIGEWRARLGIVDSIEQMNVIDLLWHTLTQHADPEGANRAKPIIPTHRGMLDLHLGGHSLVRSRRFEGRADPAWGPVRDVMQADYRAIRGQAQKQAAEVRRMNVRDPRIEQAAAKGKVNPREAREALADYHGGLHLRWLECMRRKLGVAADALVPDDLPREGTRRPETTISDDFNRADAATLGSSAEGWAWDEDVFQWQINSDRAAGRQANTEQRALASSALSSVDQEAAIVFRGNSSTANRGGPFARFRFDATHAWEGYCFYRDGGNRRIQRRVGGTTTNIWSESATYPGGTPTLLVGVDGSAIYAKESGSLLASVTDTGVTGNLHTGMFLRCGSAILDAHATDFFASDLVADAPAGLLPVMLAHGVAL